MRGDLQPRRLASTGHDVLAADPEQPRGGALREELSYFSGCIRLGERAAPVTLEEARSAVAACLAAERSASTGTVITL
jgi:hypothetical protein